MAEFRCPECGRQVPVTNGLIGRHRIAKKGPGSSNLCGRSGTAGGPPKPKKRKPQPYNQPPKRPKRNRKQVKRVCPEHGTKLVYGRTQYGARYSCPELGCTVVAWGGSTSTPANLETRAARMKAHSHFDRLWSRDDPGSRDRAYRDLRAFMGLPAPECHIGMFDVAQCDRVVEFCEQLAPAASTQESESNGEV